MAPKKRPYPQTIIKLSSSWQFTVPRGMVRLLKLEAGDLFDIAIENGKIVLKKVTIQ